MKRLVKLLGRIFLCFVAIGVFVAPTLVFAQGATGGTCDPNKVVDSCPTGTQCIANPDGNTGTCKSKTSGCPTECTAGTVCSLILQKCVPAGTGTGVGTSTGSTSVGGGGGLTDLGFVSLTKIPGFDTVGNSGNLSDFLNHIYQYCIGIAAVVAVIQLIRAGIMYMLEGGFIEKKQAKNLIGQTIAGLLLVLSPVIVFSIINPKILSLTIDTSQLQTAQKIPPATAAPAEGTDDQKKACAGYTKFSIQVLPSGKYCKDVLGAGWADLPEGCPPTNPVPPAGSTLCGYDVNNIQTGGGDDRVGTFQYSVDTKSRDDLTGKDCRLTDTKGFTTDSTCEAALKQALSFPNTAETQSCDMKQLNPPKPDAAWNAIKNLPSCPS